MKHQDMKNVTIDTGFPEGELGGRGKQMFSVSHFYRRSCVETSGTGIL